MCGESLCEVKIACFCNKILSSLPLIYTLGFSYGEMKDKLTHCVHLKRELELLLGFMEVCCICVFLLGFYLIC